MGEQGYKNDRDSLAKIPVTFVYDFAIVAIAAAVAKSNAVGHGRQPGLHMSEIGPHNGLLRHTVDGGSSQMSIDADRI